MVKYLKASSLTFNKLIKQYQEQNGDTMKKYTSTISICYNMSINENLVEVQIKNEGFRKDDWKYY